MRPLTDSKPKPLIDVAGRSLLDHTLDRVAAAGITDVVVNHRWLGEQIAAVVAQRQDLRITLSPEDQVLETGGGVQAALPLLGGEPFLILNADVFWLNGPTPAIDRLMAAWDDSQMDALLLVQRMVTGYGCEGPGDYFLDPVGRLTWRGEAAVAPHIFAGVQICHPRLFEEAPPAPFSMKALWDRAQANGRLFGILHDGLWFHLSRPGDVETTMQVLVDDRLI